MQISEAAGGAPAQAAGAEPCRFPKLEECAHFHYERVHLSPLAVALQTNMDQSLHSQHTNEDDDVEWHMVQVTSGDECWILQRSVENFKMLDAQLHQCIYDRKISQLPDLSEAFHLGEDYQELLTLYLARFCEIVDNSLNCGPILNWLQMDNRGHRLLVPSEESRSINTPAVAAAYSVRRYVSQARDELNLEVGDMISVIDMASPGESIWWRGKRGFQVGFFPQHCVHIIGDKVPRNMPLPPPVVGSLALSPIKPVLRKHGKLIAFFRSFILSRPSRRRLKQSGILKERVFGCDLGEHLLNSGHDIPMVLKCCAEFIESHGIVDGIYRLSGITSNIQKLRNAFDEDRIPNLYTEDILQDIHSVASLLKMYFRELPNPLCTYQLYQSFVTAVQGCYSANRSSESDRERLLKMREAVQKLPPPHYRTLEYLMRHLARVAKHGASTGMTTRNVAIVWAPNLLRCAELEVGGVAALQGVGIQAVVTEFLICYSDLIFCDRLPSLDLPHLNSPEGVLSPKRCRPKSLAISTPTKLITLEEARSKHMLSRGEDCGYIEVGGGPGNLPKKYHTVIELPAGGRKRGLGKRSPLGWRSFFSKSRNNAQAKPRKASTPGIIITDKSVTESDLTDMKRKLRSVKSAESLISGHSEPASTEIDVLGPLNNLSKPPGHNRSVSHDSYFDTLQNSQNNSEGSLLELSEIQLNFELEESEMRIFSEDESLVSSPRVQRDLVQRRILTRSRPEEFGSAANSSNPSPKKQPRMVLSPDSNSRKRTRLEDQLSDIQFIDCSTPENVCTISTTAVIHTLPEPQKTPEPQPCDSYQPKNKSPRNSDVDFKRQSLNLEGSTKPSIPKSLTDTKLAILGDISNFASPSVQSPVYQQLGDSSATSSPGFSPEYQKFINNRSSACEREFDYQNLVSPTTKSLPSPTYENVLTTISITYKSPSKTPPESVYEDVALNLDPEIAVVPTTHASLPVQQATQPDFGLLLADKSLEEMRPKSLSALDDFNKDDAADKVVRRNVSSEGLYDKLSEHRCSSSDFGDYKPIDLSPTTDLSLSEVIHSSTENLSPTRTSISTPMSATLSPNVSPTQCFDGLTKTSSRISSVDELSGFDDTQPAIDFGPDKRKSSESESPDENVVYQQVKYFRRSVNEINALLNAGSRENEVDEADAGGFDSLEPVYENVSVEATPNEILEDSLEGTVRADEVQVPIEENRVEIVENEVQTVEEPREVPVSSPSTDVAKLTKLYDRDSLPPCLRARNIKNQIKTRSLDENEFEREFGSDKIERRKSMDEQLSYKLNTLPKSLNQPKTLPEDEESKLRSIHLAHSTENVSTNSESISFTEQQRRERIEKYKEERRKFLQDKYRSESFKEDRDVLLSRLKVFKAKEEKIADDLSPRTRIPRPTARRKCSRSEESDAMTDSLEADAERPKFPLKESNGEESSPRESIKSRTALFESHLNQRQSDGTKRAPEVKSCAFGTRTHKGDGEEEFLRNRHDAVKNERRRHTFESREREPEPERAKRVSLESRKERSQPSYCIKDMKAIFESKSKQ